MFKVFAAFLFCYLVALSAYAKRALIIESHLPGELNHMKAVAVQMGLTFDVETIDKSTQEMKKYEIIFHALGNSNEIDRLKLISDKYPKIKLVNFGDPQSKHDIFDAIVVNHFSDGPNGDNVIRVTDVGSNIVEREVQTNLVSVDDKIKTVAVLVGGSSKFNEFKPLHARQLAASLNQVRKHDENVRFLIITSRRTPPAAEHAFFEEFKTMEADQVAFSEVISDKFNPYAEFIKKSDVVVVSADSMSMISDSVALNKPTYIFAPDGSYENRHRDFFLEHFKEGRVRPFNFSLKKYDYPSYNPNLNIALKVQEYFEMSKYASCNRFYNLR